MCPNSESGSRVLGVYSIVGQCEDFGPSGGNGGDESSRANEDGRAVNEDDGGGGRGKGDGRSRYNDRVTTRLEGLRVDDVGGGEGGVGVGGVCGSSEGDR